MAGLLTRDRRDAGNGALTIEKGLCSVGGPCRKRAKRAAIILWRCPDDALKMRAEGSRGAKTGLGRYQFYGVPALLEEFLRAMHSRAK